MFERLKSLSDDMGIPYSTLATVAVSEYVVRKEREGYTASAALEGAMKNQKDFFQELLKELPDIAQREISLEDK